MTNEAATILTVDDEPMVRDVITGLLQRAGHRVLVAESGLEAIKVLMGVRVDAVLLDLRMPGMDGQETLERITDLDPEIAVLMVTSEDDVSQAVRAVRNGAYDYILKPVTFEDLRMAVERALRLKRRRRNHGFLQSVATLAGALDARDPYTQGHSERVSVYALRLAQHTGLPATDLEELQTAAPLHDIGKIGIREEVLLKPGRLTDAEFDHIKRHPVIGASMLEHMPSLAAIRGIIRHHHERWDGRGYPDRLTGEKIPLGARILSVADAFDAMTSNRPYRSLMPDHEARRRLLECRGTQLDPDLVMPFVDLLDRGWLPGHEATTEAGSSCDPRLRDQPASLGAATPAA